MRCGVLCLRTTRHSPREDMFPGTRRGPLRGWWRAAATWTRKGAQSSDRWTRNARGRLQFSTESVGRPLREVQALERRWQAAWVRWKEEGTAMRTEGGLPSADRQKYYALSMFPYPSGNLHMGHVRVYTISDLITRYRGMRGFEVIHPMGWDAFGLPAENAARHHGVEASSWTDANIRRMRSQFDGLGLALNWDREVTTCDPDYYRWTQWLFRELYDAGLAYQGKAVVNWDPVDKTVLANEQIDADGRSWRSGAVAEQRYLKQWFFRITAFADELLEGLDDLHEWPEEVKHMQRRWIGRSDGTDVHFFVPALRGESDEVARLRVFTTRVDTIFGVTFLAVSPSHPVTDRANLSPEDRRILEKMRDQESQQLGSPAASLEKNNSEDMGVNLGLFADHPLTV